jgi:hypothetical protein
MRRSTHAAIFLVAAAACGDNQEPEEADALWARIHQEDYRSFAHAPGYEQRQPSNTAHSDFVDIYVNEVLEQVLTAGDPIAAWPVGSLIVKDGFDSGGSLALVAVLDKRADGWFFAEYNDTEAGTAKYSGQPDICLGCHDAGSDEVLAFTLPQ